MDSSAPCEDSASEYVHGTSESVHTNVTHKQCMCCKHITTDGTVGEELGNTSNELRHIQDVEKMVSGCTLGTKEGIFPREEDSFCKEPQSNQIDSPTTPNEKVLAKSATFPLSKKLACSNCTNGNDEIHGKACDGPCYINSDKPACTRSISLPTSMELVSAMKGSREKLGFPEKILTVKWAPDVYDPPVTSLSHTVNGYSQQRSRSNRKNSKQKHKGKSSRGSSEKKQHKKHTGNSEPRSKSRGASNALYESTEDYLNYSVPGQESNCGSSFLRTSVDKVHISFAEAT